MDEERFKNNCIKEKENRGGIHQPFYGPWAADFYPETGYRNIYAGKVFE